LKYNTFSITAHCHRTGQLGVAVSTKVPAVGMLCPFVKSRTGAVATQSFVNPYLGIWGLSHLAHGASAGLALDLLKKQDAGIAYRQLAIVDSTGRSAAFTGDRCDGWCGHRTGASYAIAGNMLVGGETLEAMEAEFLRSQDSPLSERLVQALVAGQDAGGDKRGRQSAALLVYGEEAYPYLDLRVDDHPEPVTELHRLHQLALEDLVPFLAMLPTRSNPTGSFDLNRSREIGLLKDGNS